MEKSRRETFQDSVYGAFSAIDYYKIDKKLNELAEEGISVEELSLQNKEQFISGTFKEVNGKILVENISNGKYCANGMQNNLIITKGSCEKPATDKKYFTFNSSTKTITGYSNEGPKDVVIPKKIDGVIVEKIGSSAFYNKKLTSVVLPDGIKTIGSSAFSSNELKNVVIPNSVTSMGYSAFQDNQLTSVVISTNITKIDYYTFENNQLKNVVIPNNIKTIEMNAFRNNQLTEINIPSGVTGIGSNAFEKNKLTNITISDTVKSLGYQVFNDNQLSDEQAFIYGRNNDGTENRTKIISYGGKKRDNVVIPTGVTTIGYRAFYENSLTSIVIPSSVITIESAAFNNNQLSDEQAFIYGRNSDGTENKSNIVSYGGMKRDNVVIPTGVTEIKTNSFYGNDLTSVIIPSSVTTIETGAFQYNKLQQITFNEGLMTIKDSAFRDNKIKSVVIPESVRFIEPQAFANNVTMTVKIIGKSSPSDFGQYFDGKNSASHWGGSSSSIVEWNATL